MTALDSRVVDEILAYLCDDLGGDWLLTGGALVRLEFDAERGTEDVDLVRIRHRELSDEAARSLLFKKVMALGLGPEWVNTAVEPFVREVPDWEVQTVEIRDGKKGRVFRPNLTLFVYLKLRRCSEVDLQDIVKAAESCPEGFDLARFEAWADSGLRERLERNRTRLGF